MNLIAAVALNGIIGDSTSNSIPWHIPTDLKHFKALTSQQVILMGSKTYRSLGRPLPNRRNVVCSTDAQFVSTLPEGVVAYESYEQALEMEPFTDFMVIGGASAYEWALKNKNHSKPNKLFITIVDVNGVGDVSFPITGEAMKKDIVNYEGSCYFGSTRSAWLEENGIKFQFVTFDRIPHCVEGCTRSSKQ